MKLIIEISKYNKEWIGNLHFIPEELRFEIGNAIIYATPFDSVLEDIEAQIASNLQIMDICNVKKDNVVIVQSESTSRRVVLYDSVMDIIDKHISGKEQG